MMTSTVTIGKLTQPSQTPTGRSEKLSNLPEVTQLIRGKSSTGAPIGLILQPIPTEPCYQTQIENQNQTDEVSNIQS